MTQTNVFELVGLVLESISYGIYCVVFGAYLRIRFKRRDNGPKAVIFYLLTVNFIMCTAYLAISIVTTLLFNPVPRLKLAHDALYTFIDLISQVILIYRCWIMWRRPLVMGVPILLSLAFLVTSLTTLVGMAIYPGFYTPQSLTPPWYVPAVVSFFSISLAVNALVTGLIVYKILSVYREFQGLKNRAAYVDGPGQNLLPLISILIESGVITFVAQLIQTIMYKLAGHAFPLVGGLVIMLYGISPTVVLVRVEMGLAYNDNEASKTVMRFSATTSANKIEHTIITRSQTTYTSESSQGMYK